MKREPFVTVLMNCYNGEKYLRPAIESVLAQTYRNWELLFWDNQSTDSTAAICKSYDDPRIRYIYADEHTELGPARIKAFQEIRGEYVAVLDADDIAHPERLMRQVEVLEQHPDVALVGSWAQYIDENGRVFGEFCPPADQQELQDSLGWTNPLIHSSIMYRHQLAREVGGYPQHLVWAQDLGLTLALAKRARIALVADYLCQVRVLSASMTRSGKYQRLIANELLSLFRQAADTLQLSGRARRLNRRTMALARIKLGIAIFRTESWWAGLSMILLGFLAAPSVLWGNGPVRRFLGAKF